MTEARKKLDLMREAAGLLVGYVQELPDDHKVDIDDLEEVGAYIEDLVSLNIEIRPDIEPDIEVIE